MKKPNKKIKYEPTQKEKKGALIKDYLNNANRLKRIPEELAMLEKNLEYVDTENQFKTKEMNLQIKDFELRHANFEVKDIKFKWETITEWVDVQKELLTNAIDKTKFSLELQKHSNKNNKSATEQQIKDVKAQRERCISAHKLVLKQLKDEFNVDTAELKNECTSPCCR